MVPEEILIVNDGSLLLKMIGGLLANKGYQLSQTDSSEEALGLLGSRNIVLAVLKLNGRQSDRLALMHMVKELDPLTKLIIVGDQAQLPVEAFEVEADDYLLLPCRIAEAWRRLTSSLKPPLAHPGVVPEEGRASRSDQPFANRSRLREEPGPGGPVDRRVAAASRKAFGKVRTGTSV